MLLFGNSQGMKKVLLVQPRTEESFWGLAGSYEYVDAKATLIPLPLVALAALLPKEWALKLIDMNIETLADEDIAAADIVFVTGMIIHREGIEQIISRCRARNTKVAVGGPFASASPEAPELREADCLYIGEAEGQDAFAQMIEDLSGDGKVERVYRAREFSDITTVPVPRYDLLKMNAYVAMAIQVSIGCLHDCEFCGIPKMKGRSRYKKTAQVLAELDAIFALGFRGSIFIVDDNFVARQREAFAIVEAIRVWQESRGFPFLFYTQADISLGIGTGIELAEKMSEAGFYAVFLGLESSSVEAMASVDKRLNATHDPVAVCRNIRKAGMVVYGGFIVGFDTDDVRCFATMARFVDDCAVYAAMVGMLTVLPDTRLEARLAKEARLLSEATGDSMQLLTMKPQRMSPEALLSGYRDLLAQVYEPRNYFRRATASLREWKAGRPRPATKRDYRAALRSFVRQGLFSRYRWSYWRFILRFLFSEKKAMAFFVAVMYAHFDEYANRVVIPRLDTEIRKIRAEN